MPNLTRRRFLTGTTALTLSALAGVPTLSAAPRTTALTAKPSRVAFFGKDAPSTDVWSYGSVPGPQLRVKQGERLSVSLTNELPDPTTIHWHGLRMVNAMDGVPYLTQEPIQPGETFTYDFIAKDAGTYWYHPHVNSAEQVGRGLSGALIVEEPDPIEVDRDIVWVVDDWRIKKDAGLAEFGGFHDMAHGGRMGNMATINGNYDEKFSVQSGERIRLRLINTANARVFGLQFKGLNPWRVAVDGHPVIPSQMEEGLVVIPPGGRTDLVIDFRGNPGEKFAIIDNYYQRQPFTLIEGSYTDQPPVRTEALEPPKKMADNPVAQPDLANAERHDMIFEGGAMGGLRQAELNGEILGLRELASQGLLWAVNGKMYPHMTKDDLGEPMLSMQQGKTYILTWTNNTAFDHPIHMHGHSFHVISRNGEKLETPIIMDTVLIQPQQSVEVAFVADNPGKWALHCHILEHAEAGMMGYVTVA
ncbi:MAG: multicopper oxidase family protein [Magnetovibrio sp.]|nr:multicopper oxidase family protein [Magnetovibrio sp.]